MHDHQGLQTSEPFQDLFARMRGSAATAEGADAPDAVAPMIDTIEECVEVGNRAISDFIAAQDRATPEEIARCRSAGHQVVTGMWLPHAAGFLGKVTKGRMWHMVQAQLRQDLFQKTHRRSGRWILAYAGFDAVYRTYHDVRGEFVGQDAKQSVNPIARKMRHFFVPYVLIEVSGKAPLVYSDVDGMPMRSTHDAGLIEAVRSLGEERKGSQPDLGMEPYSDRDELLARLARLEAMVEMGSSAPEETPKESPISELDARMEEQLGAAEERQTKQPPRTPRKK